MTTVHSVQGQEADCFSRSLISQRARGGESTQRHLRKLAQQDGNRQTLTMEPCARTENPPRQAPPKSKEEEGIGKYFVLEDMQRSLQVRPVGG